MIAEHKLLGDKSPYKEFINALPKKTDNFPVMFNEERKDMLKNTLISKKIIAGRAW
jgi:hypothetical protein